MEELMGMSYTHHIHLGPLNSSGIEELIQYTFKSIIKPGDSISKELIEEVQIQSQGATNISQLSTLIILFQIKQRFWIRCKITMCKSKRRSWCTFKWKYIDEK